MSVTIFITIYIVSIFIIIVNITLAFITIRRPLFISPKIFKVTANIIFGRAIIIVVIMAIIVIAAPRFKRAA
eukprot:639956-Pyramimonas_sp.AAC.1